MELINIIISFVVGGGLVTLLTLPSIRSKAKADAMQSIQDVYQETIRDLREEKKRQKDELTAQINEFRAELEHYGREIESLKKIKCYDMSCPIRKKHQ